MTPDALAGTPFEEEYARTALTLLIIGDSDIVRPGFQKGNLMPDASKRGGQTSGKGGNPKQGGTTAQKKAAGRKGGKAAAKKR